MSERARSEQIARPCLRFLQWQCMGRLQGAEKRHIEICLLLAGAKLDTRVLSDGALHLIINLYRQHAGH